MIRGLATEFLASNSFLVEVFTNFKHSSSDVKYVNFNGAVLKVATDLVISQLSDAIFSFLIELLFEGLAHGHVVRVSAINDELILLSS